MLNSRTNILLNYGENLMKIITFLTDFGKKSSYVSQMKAIALSIADTKIVDISHEITPHDIREGAYVLQSTVPYFPSGTIHIAVVDPGVGTNRKGIVITTRSQILVGPDNGLLIPTARRLGDFKIYEITNQNLMLSNISNTFHGRDIFTPVAANILNGIEFEQIGPIVTDFIDLNFGKSEIFEKLAIGKIVYLDNFGNVITNIDGFKIMRFIEYGKKFFLDINGKQYEIPFVKSYNFVKKDELLATIGSSNLLEFSVNQGNASKKLQLKPDDSIKIHYN